MMPTIRTAGHPMAGRLLLITVLACGLLTACDDAPSAQAPDSTSTRKPIKDKTAVLPANMVSAVSAGKSSAMISVHFALAAVPAVDSELPVDIAIVPHRPFTSVRARFEGHPSLRMSSGFLVEPRKDVASETVLHHKLMLLPSQDGVFLVSAVVETEGDDGSVTRVYSIPVIIHGTPVSGKPPGETPPAPATGAPTG
jgi:hypothetical protein